MNFQFIGTSLSIYLAVISFSFFLHNFFSVHWHGACLANVSNKKNVGRKPQTEIHFKRVDFTTKRNICRGLR